MILRIGSLFPQDHEVIIPPKEKGLNDYFKNALISDLYNNISRENNIRITENDTVNKRIRTNYPIVSDLNVPGSGGESWFICQGGEASTLVEILSVDENTGWINYGTTYLGSFNTSVGAKVEFMNPFVNYRFIPGNRPLLDPYPENTSAEGSFNYIQSGGIFQKSDGKYILFTPVIFGAHASRSIYYATSNDLLNWTFEDDLLLAADSIPFAKNPGNVFTVGNPFRLETGNLLVMLAVQQKNGNYTSAYMVINEDLEIITEPTEVGLPNWSGDTNNTFPLDLTYFNGKFRLLLHRRLGSADLEKETWEITFEAAKTDSNLLEMLNGVIVPTEVKIHDADKEKGYLNGKFDDGCYIQFKGNLYLIIGSEQENVGQWVTSNNREYGLARLVGETWEHDVRSPLLINPMQMHNKYPELDFAWDHMGGFISPWIENDKLFLFAAQGTDNPDYFLTGMQVQL